MHDLCATRAPALVAAAVFQACFLMAAARRLKRDKALGGTLTIFRSLTVPRYTWGTTPAYTVYKAIVAQWVRGPETINSAAILLENYSVRLWNTQEPENPTCLSLLSIQTIYSG